MKRAIIAAAGALLLTGIFGLTFRRMNAPVITPGPNVRPAAGPTAARPNPAQASKPKGETLAPDFTLKDMDGRNVTLSSFRGRKVVVLDFWATWCGPCIMSMPAVDRVAKRHVKDVEVLSINQREDPEMVAQFVRERLSTAPHVLFDVDGSVSAMYRVYGIPTLFIIDREGVARHKLTGYRPNLEAHLESLLAPLL